MRSLKSIKNWTLTKSLKNNNFSFKRNYVLRFVPSLLLTNAFKSISGWKNYKATPLLSLNKLNKNLKKICVYNIIPPTQKKYLDIAGHVSCIGSDEERKKYYQYFNELIKNNCLQNNFIFIDVYKEHLDVDGYLDRKYSDGGVSGDFHLKKSEHIFNFLKNNIL